MLVPRYCRTMAGGAFSRRGPVKNYRPSHYFPRGRVAAGAENISMRSVKFVVGLGIVIKSGGLPFQHSVTLFALRRLKAR